MATPQGRRLGCQTPEQVSYLEPPVSRQRINHYAPTAGPGRLLGVFCFRSRARVLNLNWRYHAAQGRVRTGDQRHPGTYLAINSATGQRIIFGQPYTEHGLVNYRLII